jgi:hypothetical protein
MVPLPVKELSHESAIVASILTSRRRNGLSSPPRRRRSDAYQSYIVILAAIAGRTFMGCRSSAALKASPR